MAKRSKDQDRTMTARAILDIDEFWADIFARTQLNDLNYCDLFTQMWLNRETSLPKTELYSYMPNISQRTAVKYIQRAIDEGMLEECDCEHDRRVKLVSLSKDCEARVRRFLDFTFTRFRKD
ncbi:MAG: hypothetical protein R3208_19855 [Ketobacteraceae bacterium]|nr:hypothetical protein [Ketobacteraceae bacterium]